MCICTPVHWPCGNFQHRLVTENKWIMYNNAVHKRSVLKRLPKPTPEEAGMAAKE